jgi:Protein of unknown function (DUF3667)
MTARVCKNCTAPITERYCAHCGQRADTEIPTLWGLIAESLDTLYSFDSRVWRSLVPLLFKPGKLTNEYIAGRRQAYLPPFRMYFVISLVFFLLTSLIGPNFFVARSNIDSASQSAQAPEADATSCHADIQGFLNPEWAPRIERACEKIVADSGDSLSRALIQNTPKMMFLFIPVVAAIMKVLYPFLRRRYVEHLLFFFHFHAFFFLLAILELIGSRLATALPMLSRPIGVLTAVGWIYLPVYLFLALRRVYQQSRLATTVKYGLLSLGYFVTLGLTFALGLLYSALTL